MKAREMASLIYFSAQDFDVLCLATDLAPFVQRPYNFIQGISQYPEYKIYSTNEMTKGDSFKDFEILF